MPFRHGCEQLHGASFLDVATARPAKAPAAARGGGVVAGARSAFVDESRRRAAGFLHTLCLDTRTCRLARSLVPARASPFSSLPPCDTLEPPRRAFLVLSSVARLCARGQVSSVRQTVGATRPALAAVWMWTLLAVSSRFHQI